MRTLITGHRGFVGRHMWHHLTRSGHEVTGVDIQPGKRTGVGRELLGRDVREFFHHNKTTYDLVVHCAAVIGGRVGIDSRPIGIATNLAIDHALWEWALRTRPGRVVYYSSSAAYPTCLQIQSPHSMLDMLESWGALSEDRIHYPADSRYVGSPDAMYGWVKLTGEILAQHVREAGVPVTVLRPFSGYGSDQDRDYPFGAFLHRARSRADPFTVWGDGTHVRDWIHIDDIVDATMAAVEHNVDGPVNLCTGRPISFNELARMMTTAAGYDPAIHHILDAPKGVEYRVGDPTLLHGFYRPQITLEDGIQRALASG